jgi:hypothetical protein
MPWSLDARIPVTLAAPGAARAGAQDAALLVEEGLPAPRGAWVERFDGAAHGVGCADPGCVGCAPRAPAALALDRLFLARARGQAPFFRSVVVVSAPERHAALAAVLRDDAVVSARYRMA